MFIIKTLVTESSQDKLSLSVVVNCEEHSWKVFKTVHDFVELSKNICELRIGKLVILRTDSGVSQFDDYLKNIIAEFGDAIWNCAPFLHFIDNLNTVSIVQQLQFTRMTSLIRKLEEKNFEQERTIESLQSKCNALSKSSKQSQSPISVFETEPLDLTASETEERVCVEVPVSPCSRLRSTSTSSLDCDAHNRVSTISAISGLTDTSSVRDSFFARDSFLSSRDSISGIRDSQSTAVTEATEVTDISVLGCIPEVDEQDIISRSSNSTNNSKNDYVPDTTVLSGGSGSLDVSSNDIIDVSSLSLNEKAAEFVPSPTLKYISSDIYPTAETLDYYTPVVDIILTTLSQHESQLQYRNSIVTFLQKQVRCSLGVNSFDITLHKLHCALPDDAVKVSIVINKQDASQWYKPVLERLNQAAERNGAATFDDPALVNVMELINPASTSELGNALKSVVLPHTLCNVQLTTSKSSHRINCLVDSLPAEITTNNRVDLIFLAFFEDLDGLVGQNHLFKRSVLLIRAWWHYESSAYLNMAVKHHIVDNALCVMIAAVFNIYHSILTSPLQVLLIFLQEYCQYNGTTHAITLQGLVPFKEGGASNQPDLVQPAPDHLIQSPLIEKYFRIANVNLAGNAHAFDLAGEEMASCSPHYQAMVQRQLLLQQQQKAALLVTSGENEAVITATDDTQQQSPVQKPLTRGKKHAPILPPVTSVTATLITTFERLDFNIVSPWEHTNMMVTAQESGSLAFKLSSNAVMRLHKVFTTGYTNLSAILRQSAQSVSPTAADKTSTTSTTPIPHCQELNSFFPTVLARFGTDWRPDAINNSIEPDANMSLTTNKQQRYSYLELMSSCASQSLMWQNVLYCNLVLESVLTESALLTLSCEILADKGPLPVGEIGKMLSEITTFPHFTTKLKEMFGGLKKFLENFPHVIFISLDHPFNPNVLLRSSVSPEQFALIEQGLLPIQNVIKSRKAALTAAAAVNTQTKKVQSRAHMPHHGGMDSMGGMGEYDMGIYNGGGYRGGPQPHMHYTPNKQQQYMGHQHQQQQLHQSNGYNSRTPMPSRGAHQHGRGFQQQHGYSPVSHPAHAQLSHQQMMLSQAEALLRARNSLTTGRDLSGVQGMQQYDPRDLNDDGAAMYYSYNQSQSQGAAHQSLHQHHHGKQQSMSTHEYSDHHFGNTHLPSLHISEQPYDDYHYDDKLLGSALGGLSGGLGGLDDDVLSLSSYAATRGSLGSEFGTGRNSEYGRNSDFGTGRSSQGSASDFALGPSRGSLSSLSDYPQQQTQSLSPHNLLGGRQQQQVSPLASPPPVTSMMSALRENTVELVSGFGGSNHVSSSGLGGLHSSNPNPLNGLGGLHSAGAGNAASQDQEEEFRPRERSRNTSVDYTPPAHHHNSLFSRLAASTSRFY